MVHRVSQKKLSRSSRARAALLKGLTNDLILHEKVVTTAIRAKAVRPFLEKLVTLSKENSLVTRRRLLAKLGMEQSVRKLLEVVGPAFKERAGGYTRITKLPPRAGDNAKMAALEFVENVSELAAKRKIATPRLQKETKAKKQAAPKPLRGSAVARETSTKKAKNKKLQQRKTWRKAKKGLQDNGRNERKG